MEKRRSPRYDVEAAAIMRVEGRIGPFLVTILDVSVTGLRISSPRMFLEGTRVTLTCRGETVTGEVRHMWMVGRETHIGIAVDGASGRALSENGEIDLTRLFQKRLGE